MNFQFAHYNYNVIDLDKSIRFYEEALGLKEIRRKEAEDGSFILVYLGDGATGFELELTWLRDWEKDHYNLGDNEIHLAFTVDNMEEAQRNIRKWAVSVSRILPWEFILSMIRTDTGWRLFRQNNTEKQAACITADCLLDFSDLFFSVAAPHKIIKADIIIIRQADKHFHRNISGACLII